MSQIPTSAGSTAGQLPNVPEQPESQRNPLSQSQYQAINQSLRMLGDVRAQIDRAKAAMVPCDERDQLCNFLQQRLDALKRTYFPNQP